MRTDLIRKTALTAAGLICTGAVAGQLATAGAESPTTGQATASAKNDRPSHGERELNMRYAAQPNFYYCGPSATRNALSVQGKDVDVHAMAREMGTTEAGTDSIHDITPVLNRETGKKVYRSVEIRENRADREQTDKLRTDIVRTVDDGRAVVANVAGTATDTDGLTHSFENGHYISVIGYREGGNVVTIADSADAAQASYRMSVDNLADWIATRGYAAVAA
ncbi:C39 family peptidase [Micromonospora sp. URMC 105]|uniref:C39 family peptidase n=1 Tax=Micromonospora sp. URMC 105 TaxID=3423413 RepID=UPI003F1B883B